MSVQNQSSSECPSCGRFVGPYERCPYCGADVGQRMVVRVLKYGSLVLAIGGLAVLFFAATRTGAPTVEIGQLAKTMNWAYVRIEGVAARQPSFDEESRSLTFWVSDGTGEIMVTAYRAEAEVLLGKELVPVMGDRIAVEGTLRIREDFQYLILNAPQQIEIWPPEPAAVSIAGVDAKLAYRKVVVQGVIREDRVPYAGLRILTLRDATGKIDVTLSPGAVDLGQDFPHLSVGQSVQVTGAVEQYKGVPQISVGRVSDLVVLDEAITIAASRPINMLSEGDVDSLVVVEGMISKVDPFSAGFKYRLDDGSGQVTLLLWQNLQESLVEHDPFVVGTTVRVQGEVAEYHGELEIVPQILSDVTVMSTAEPNVGQRQLSELGYDDVGRLVRVEGVLRSLRTFSAGMRGLLDDGTGVVTLLLWQDVYDRLPEPASLVPGSILYVEGEVREYKGELEVVPQFPADLKVVGTVTLPLEMRAIAQISAADVGQMVQVKGQIAGLAPFSNGWRCALDDGTGTITLLLWQTLYDEIPDPNLLATGAHVSVRGEVHEYQGQLEVVPQLPADVVATRSDDILLAVSTPISEPGVGSMVPSKSISESIPLPGPTASEVIPPPAPSPTAASTPTPFVETRTIGTIAKTDEGRVFTIARADIADLAYFSAGVKYTLTDSTGSIILLVWQNVMEEIPDRYALVPGSQVQATGLIDVYQDNLEIIPRLGAEVLVLHQGERLPIEERSLNNVTPADEGRIFAVEGIVTRTEHSGWFKIWISDGTGEILAFVPERTVAYLPPGIGSGVRLRITGEVDIYKDVIEILPLAGVDVEVR